MQQVSVLETNIGSSTTGNSANTQVIFNDAGTLRGDTGLTYDKSADRLSFGAGICYGLLTSASATITGDLTVDTNTLKVDSTNNRVGIVNASPTRALDVVGSAIVSSEIRCSTFDTGTTSGDLYLFTSNRLSQTAAPTIECQNSSKPLIINHTGSQSMLFGIGSSLQMTLNSTGLGVGTSPSATLDIRKNASGSRFLSYHTGGNGTVTAAADLNEMRCDDTTTAYNLLNINVLGTSRFLVTSTGNVGIGVTPSAWISSWKAIDINTAGAGLSGTAAITNLTNNCFLNASAQWIYKGSFVASRYQQSGGEHQFYTATAGTGGLQIGTFTQAMTLDASGNLLVGVTAAPSGTIGGSGFIADSNSRKQLHLATTASTSQVLAVFINPNGTVGTIETNGSSTAYNISSDYRLKEEVKPLTGALNRITALKPSTYKWKVDGSVGEGFIAHELAEVVPFAVSGQKDAVNADGSIKTQGVDLSKIVPILVAAIQELTARVQTLETR